MATPVSGPHHSNESTGFFPTRPRTPPTTDEEHPEFGPRPQRPTQVHRGGFRSLATKPTGERSVFSSFPPASNAAYFLTAEGRFPEPRIQDQNTSVPATAAKVEASSTLSSQDTEDEGLEMPYRGIAPPLASKKSKDTDDEGSEMPYRGIPPPLASEKYYPRRPSVDSVNRFKEETLIVTEKEVFTPTKVLEKPTLAQIKVSHPTKGERLADTIDWTRPCWVSQPIGACGPLLPPEEMRLEFIQLIDAGAPFIFCTKCGLSHIPPGPPITLQDRDTCGSMLPDWWPSEDFAKPWDTFIKLFNEIIELDEMSQGFTHRNSPLQPEWDLFYHESDPKWKEVRGRRHGFWKCRTGPTAPSEEQSCTVCHVPKTAEEIEASRQRAIPIETRKASFINYIKKKIHEGALKDIEMIRRYGTGF